MKMTRLYATNNGESRFADEEVDFSLTDYAPPAPPLDLSPIRTAKQFAFMTAPAGWFSDWHPSSARNFFVVLTGEWEVTASDGETRRFGVSSILLVEDTTGKGHTSRVLSDSIVAMVELSN